MTLLLSEADVKKVLLMEDAIHANDVGFREHALGRTLMPQRLSMHLKEAQGVLLTMAAYVGGSEGGVGVKHVGVFPRNPISHNLPTTLGLLILNDPDTGEVLAVMDATYMTAIRTGAGGGVAAKYLAKKDARKVGLFGTGAQAETQLMAACTVRPIEEAYVCSRLLENAEAFARKMSESLNIKVKAVLNPRDAVSGMDIIITATTAIEPLFDGAWLEPGQHINAVGAHLPAAREIDTVAVQRSTFFVDVREACMKEAGEILIPIRGGILTEDHIAAEIGQVSAGLHAGRTRDDEITVFKSVGVAIQDVTTAKVVFERARSKGIGYEFKF